MSLTLEIPRGYAAWRGLGQPPTSAPIRWETTRFETGGFDVATRLAPRSEVRLLSSSDWLLVDVDGHTALSCGSEGRVHVALGHAPPLLVVSAEGTRPVPEPPATEADLRLEPGQRLVLLSSEAFASRVGALRDLVHRPTRLQLHADPASLLETLVPPTEGAGGVVISRLGESRAPGAGSG